MLGYYPNGNDKPRGSNLNEKIQTLISLTFHKHLCWLIYIDTNKHINNHIQTQTQETPIHIYSRQLNNKQIQINTCIHTYMYTYQHIHTYTQIYTYIHTYILIHRHTHIYIHA